MHSGIVLFFHVLLRVFELWTITCLCFEKILVCIHFLAQMKPQSVGKFIFVNNCINRQKNGNTRTIEFWVDFQLIHQGYPTETLVRFLKARDGNVSKAHKMVRCIYVLLNFWVKTIAFEPCVWIDLHFSWSIKKLFQLVDCLNWRIQNEIDSILAVSFYSYLETS